jgi:hypothetical protein
LQLGYYTDHGNLIYAGRLGIGMPGKFLPICAPAGPAGPENIASEHYANAQTRFGSPLVRALGRAEACR